MNRLLLIAISISVSSIAFATEQNEFKFRLATENCSNSSVVESKASCKKRVTKIAVIGNCGSGKSTFALKLHQALGIPLYYLDQYFWKPGWQPSDEQEFVEKHQELCDKDEWIIEGMAHHDFDYRAQKADIIIFLDTPLWLCFYRIYKRAIMGFGKVRDSSAPGCPNRMPTWGLLSYTWKSSRKRKLIIETLQQKYEGQNKFFVLKNNDDLKGLVECLELDMCGKKA